MADSLDESYETTWANAGIVADIIELTAKDPSLRVSALWNRQNEWNGALIYKDDDTYKPSRIDYHMLDRIVWLTNPARTVDLNSDVLREFRDCATNAKPFEENAALEHLPLIKLDELKGISERYNTHGRKGARVAQPDQIAAIYHLTRINASFRACQTFFTEEMPSAAVNATRLLVNERPNAGGPGWNWNI